MQPEKSLKIIAVLMYLMGVLLFAMMGAMVTYQLNPSLFEPKVIEPKTWTPKDIHKDLPSGREEELIKYGYLLTSESSKWVGPMIDNEDLRFSGNNLACKNCHLDVGTRPGAASWVGVTNRYPQFRGRANKVVSIEDRINGCMERSLNGRKLPEESKQMKAMVAYMEWLSDGIPEERQKEFQGFSEIKIPVVMANPEIGKAIYVKECQVCHGEQGQGIWLPDSTKGYLYPPVWGKDSYNHGAGMNRVLTAAQFIKGNMPWGQATRDNPKLTDEEAYHVAAYIDSFDRPLKANAETDFPDIKLKPVSTPYGPWADDFSSEQHKYGPFQPIITYYKDQYNITKTK